MSYYQCRRCGHTGRLTRSMTLNECPKCGSNFCYYPPNVKDEYGRDRDFDLDLIIPKVLKESAMDTKKFKHYKGKIYHIQGFSQDEETGAVLVTYRQESGSQAFTQAATRFFGLVQNDDKMVPRFTPEKS